MDLLLLIFTCGLVEIGAMGYKNGRVWPGVGEGFPACCTRLGRCAFLQVMRQGPRAMERR